MAQIRFHISEHPKLPGWRELLPPESRIRADRSIFRKGVDVVSHVSRPQFRRPVCRLLRGLHFAFGFFRSVPSQTLWHV